MKLPSFSTGFAKSKGESLHPDLWDGLVGLWSPEMGKQGDRLYDWSGKAHHGTLNSMDAATDYIGGKFGYALNFDGSNDNIITNNITEINTVSQTMTVMFWVRTTAASNNCILCYDNNDSLSPSSDWYIYTPANLTYGGFCDTNERASGVAINDGKWHHCCIVARQTSTEFWMDGILRSSATGLTHKVSPTSDYTTSHTFRFGDNSNVSHFPGDLGEVRLYNRDLSGDQIRRSYLGQSPLQSSPIYLATFNGDNTVSVDVLNLSSSLQTPTLKIDLTIAPTILTVVSSIQTPTDIGNLVIFNPSVLTLASSIQTPTETTSSIVSPTILTLTSSTVSPTFPGLNGASFATKIISFNPLIFVTDTNPGKVVIVDTTDPINLTWNVYTLEEGINAKDCSFNEETEFIYIACASGKVIKIDYNDLGDQTTIDTEDTDDLILIDLLPAHGLAITSTDNAVAELYLIDERSTFVIDTDMQVLRQNFFTIDTDFRTINALFIDSNIQVLGLEQFFINTDFKLVNPVALQTPIGQKDFHLFIDNVEVLDPDLALDTISITHTIDQESVATFRLNRKHDDLNHTLEGDLVTITNQNNIRIEIDGRVEFPKDNIGTAKIGELDCQYNLDQDCIIVTAFSSEPAYLFNHVTLSLPSLDKHLGLYDVLIQNPRISNPYIDPNAENPKKYLGILVNLGQKIEQRVSRYFESDPFGDIAIAIQDGTFVPQQNWSYFWSATVIKPSIIPQILRAIPPKPDNTISFYNIQLPVFKLPEFSFPGSTASGTTSMIHFNYIGTSLAPVSSDIWLLKHAEHHKQRVYDDLVTELGTYTVGSAPFKEINPRNGWLLSKYKYVDQNDGLYLIKDESYNYIDFAKKCADLEYQKLLNINNQILPETACSMNLTVDCYYYNNLRLLTRINVDNTTEENSFVNNNGFPVSIKSIVINSSDMSVNLQTDNLKSSVELEELDALFPDDEDPIYLFPESELFIDPKVDMKSGLQVE